MPEVIVRWSSVLMLVKSMVEAGCKLAVVQIYEDFFVKLGTVGSRLHVDFVRKNENEEVDTITLYYYNQFLKLLSMLPLMQSDMLECSLSR